jgi:hypothetical protein
MRKKVNLIQDREFLMKGNKTRYTLHVIFDIKLFHNWRCSLGLWSNSTFSDSLGGNGLKMSIKWRYEGINDRINSLTARNNLRRILSFESLDIEFRINWDILGIFRGIETRADSHFILNWEWVGVDFPPEGICPVVEALIPSLHKGYSEVKLTWNDRRLCPQLLIGNVEKTNDHTATTAPKLSK